MGFNPLDRGNLYQIFFSEKKVKVSLGRSMFQSPISGKFVSDKKAIRRTIESMGYKFQSPRSGKFVSDGILSKLFRGSKISRFNPLDRGNLYQIAQKTLVN